MKAKVFVTRRIPQEGLELLEEGGVEFEVFSEDRPIGREELLEGVKDKEGLLCLLTDRVDREVMEAAPGLRVISLYAVGYDKVDLQEATRRGILVTNTPGVLTDATADLAWALLFAAARRVVEADRFFRSGKWNGWGPLQFLGADITGRTLGVVGAGRIGTNFAKKAKGFGMKVLYVHPRRNPELEEELGARRVSLEELLRESDFVSLHVPLTGETRGMIGAAELSLMKPGAVLVNTSRGPVVDERALVAALREGRPAAAGLDVYENEPLPAPGLTDLPNVVCLPHIGSATVGTRTRMARMAARNLLDGLEGKVPPNLVNPEALEGDRRNGQR